MRPTQEFRRGHGFLSGRLQTENLNETAVTGDDCQPTVVADNSARSRAVRCFLLEDACLKYFEIVDCR